MYSIANTEEKILKCLEYLKSKNIAHFPGTIYFCVEEEGVIQAIAGWNKNLGGVIEPFYAETNFKGNRLFCFLIGYLTAMGYTQVTVITKTKKVIDIIKRFGFVIHPNIDNFWVNQI